MTDQTTPSNTSSVVTLTGDSTASGIGVQFFYNGTGPLMMGPDSSSAGTTGQFFIQTTSSAQTLSLPFQAQYIRTGDLIPGSANALASITFRISRLVLHPHQLIDPEAQTACGVQVVLFHRIRNGRGAR